MFQIKQEYKRNYYRRTKAEPVQELQKEGNKLKVKVEMILNHLGVTNFLPDLYPGFYDKEK